MGQRIAAYTVAAGCVAVPLVSLICLRLLVPHLQYSTFDMSPTGALLAPPWPRIPAMFKATGYWFTPLMDVLYPHTDSHTDSLELDVVRPAGRTVDGTGMSVSDHFLSLVAMHGTLICDVKENRWFWVPIRQALLVATAIAVAGIPVDCNLRVGFLMYLSCLSAFAPVALRPYHSMLLNLTAAFSGATVAVFVLSVKHFGQHATMCYVFVLVGAFLHGCACFVNLATQVIGYRNVRKSVSLDRNATHVDSDDSNSDDEDQRERGGDSQRSTSTLLSTVSETYDSYSNG
eukprot:NODE_2468_length_1058_cov_76.407089_g2450_i0.p1 GENE.NODE_2468_length_1058_cov_76.407089_g2450_i0~~NODE_2468_length_1058_cov_76.407089_g2450_i0.p1  ORF type:complete len:318 (+),score=58.85 NODE_2468_length_1058_cov_76.407089_g2450_i0:92-955(+)